MNLPDSLEPSGRNTRSHQSGHGYLLVILLRVDWIITRPGPFGAGPFPSGCAMRSLRRVHSFTSHISEVASISFSREQWPVGKGPERCAAPRLFIALHRGGVSIIGDIGFHLHLRLRRCPVSCSN